MNILDAEDMIKGLPDQALMQEAQMPSGQMPQFLVVSEIQRRSDMRKRYQAQQQEAMPSVKDQIVQEGIMGMMPQQPMGMPPQGMPPQGMPPGMPPMGMAQGGIVRMSDGGQAKLQTLMDILAVGGVSAPDLIAQGYTIAEIDAAQNQLRERMSTPVAGMGDALAGGEISAPERAGRISYGDQYDPPLVRGITDVVSDKASEVADALGRGIDSFRLEAQKQMPNYGLFGRNDLSLPSLPMPDRMSQAEMAEMFSPEEVAERLANRPSLVDDTAMTPMEFFRQRVFGSSDEDVKPAGGKEVQSVSAIQKQSIPQVGGEAFDFATSIFPSVATGDDVPVTPPMRPDVDIPEVADDKPGTETAPPITGIVDLAADLYTDESDPKLDLSDLIGDSRRMAQANALMQLGAGIAGGDLSKGISAAGAAATKGMQDARTLEMKKRLAEYQAGREDLSREEKSRQFYDQLEVIKTRYGNELEKSARIGRNELFRTASSLVEAAMGESMLTGEQRKAMVDRLMNEYLSLYGPAFGVTDIPAMPPPSGAGDYSGFSIRR